MGYGKQINRIGGGIGRSLLDKIQGQIKKTTSELFKAHNINNEVKRVENLKSESVRAREDFKKQYENNPEALRRMKKLLSEKEIRTCLERTSCAIRFTVKKEYIDVDRSIGTHQTGNDFVNISYDKKNTIPYLTTIHELTHYMTKGQELYIGNPLLGGFIRVPFFSSYQEYLKKREDTETMSEKDFMYLVQTKEIHAFINEIRYICNPNDPRKKITQKDIQDCYRKYKDVPTYSVIMGLLRLIKPDKLPEFVFLYNELI